MCCLSTPAQCETTLSIIFFESNKERCKNTKQGHLHQLLGLHYTPRPFDSNLSANQGARFETQWIFVLPGILCRSQLRVQTLQSTSMACCWVHDVMLLLLL